MKISRLEIENVKRIQAVGLEPSKNGLTIIGGRNGQGKTSVLDAIVWALGGNKYKPSEPQRADSMANPSIVIELDNGLVVSRTGKNGTLKVTDQHGQKGGQALLDSLISTLALDLPKFMAGSGKEKADTLLQIIGVGEQLARLDKEIDTIYNQRHSIGQIYDRKQKHADDLPFDPTAPKELVSASEIIQQQQGILQRNASRKAARDTKTKLEANVEACRRRIAEAEERLREANRAFEAAMTELVRVERIDEDESTAELEAKIGQVGELNARVRRNMQRDAALAEAAELAEQRDELTRRLEGTRASRLQLLSGAPLPLPGLSIQDGELTYNGQKWDCMSSTDQLRVSVAIVRELRPECKFVLLDKLEAMDMDTLTEFGKWLEQQDLQVIATRVSTGGECSIIIEDGIGHASASDSVIIPPTIPPNMPFDEEGF